MTNIVCYMGGCCGDLVAATIDGLGCALNGKVVKLPSERSALKKPHLFLTDDEKDQYLASCNQYGSIVSHDADYHIKNKHKFISIGVTDFEDAIWAARRFKHLHRSSVWDEMVAASGAKDVKEYAQMMVDYSSWISAHAEIMIDLSDILNGDLLTVLKDHGLPSESSLFYHNWIATQHFDYTRSMRLLDQGFVVGV